MPYYLWVMSVFISQKSRNTILVQLIYQLLPTGLIVYFLLWQSSFHSSIFHDQYQLFAGVLFFGMICSVIIHHTRLRFLPTFLVLAFAGWFISYVLSQIVFGGLDTFLIGHWFSFVFIFFCIGWIIGFGFTRLRFWSVVTAILVILIGVWLISRRLEYFQEYKGWQSDWLIVLLPLAVYSIYIIFISEQIWAQKRIGNNAFRRILGNSVAFLIISLLLFGLVFYLSQENIRHKFQDLSGGNGQQNNSNGMMSKDGDGSFSFNDSTKVSGNNNNSKNNNPELVFAAYINNFFEDGITPNPLYLTAFYYAKYDTLTETFQRAYDMPDKDLFAPAPGKIPLYKTVTDSSVLRFSKNDQFQKTVEIEVYNKRLNDHEFVAPTTAYAIQPFAVDSAFQNEYKSAYIAKSKVSELNSAYFVYNTTQPILKQFQDQRYEVLRTVKDFSEMDSTAYYYYTVFPNAENLQPIKQKAFEITKGMNTPMDKILAIKNYFLSEDELGQPLFKYSDNPGIPDIPSRSKLTEFLLHTHTGYCAHYAGATLFMLRALGIPSRIVVGFLTVDRSTNNKGWYYFYEDQAHAWVQVYFPGFGWLDFDTTIGNDEARESGQTDATPPLQPSKAVLAINGIIHAIDTNKKIISVKTDNIMYLDNEYDSESEVMIPENVSMATFYKDTNNIRLDSMKVGDTIASISYNRRIILPSNNIADFNDLVDRLPDTVNIDVIVIRQLHSKDKSNALNTKTEKSNYKWVSPVLLSIGILILLGLILLPRILMQYYLYRSKHSKHYKTTYYYSYLGATYYLWIHKFERHQQTPLEFSKDIDDKFGTQFASFMNQYLYIKYNNDLSLHSGTSELNFLPHFIQILSKKVNKRDRFKNWLRFDRAIQFIIKST